MGTAAATTRGFKEKEFEFIAILINDVITGLSNKEDNNDVLEKKTRKKILDLCNKFPLYTSL